ncbi:MAG: TylF/MycF/NovP-related O-methyltransferase [Ginsengibacter sp.]
MIKLPEFKNAFDHENDFYLSSQPGRLIKPLIHYELYKQTMQIPGAFAEFGLFKGTSFIRFLTYRFLLETVHARKFFGFDVFGKFPDAELKGDKQLLEKYLQNAGDQSITKDQLLDVLSCKGLKENVELIEGDIADTVPEFINKNPGLRFSLIHLDVDLYKPSVVVLEEMYPLLSKGGILILDDYAIWEGETKAVDEYFKGNEITIRRFPFAEAPSYIIKD